jgi:hypothetical protein
VKGIGGVDRVLAGHGIGDEEYLLWSEELLEPLHLFHQIVVEREPTGSIDNQRVTAGVDRVASRFLC